MRGRQLSKGTEPNPTRARARTEIRQISEKRSERGDTDAKAKPPLGGGHLERGEGAARHATPARGARRGRAARAPLGEEDDASRSVRPELGPGRRARGPGRRRHRPRTQQA